MVENSDEDLWESADGWKAAAIALAIGTPCVCVFFVPWVYAAGTDGVMLQRVQIVGSLAAFGVALVTFCTVVWRGLISTQQAKLQRLQIDKLSTQISVTEENNLATLLQKGAELLADSKPGYANAGIATLQAVITSPIPKFSTEAMNLIADFIQSEFSHSHSSTVFKAAANALFSGAKLGRRADRRLAFVFPDTEARIKDAWQPVFGVLSASYSRGQIDPDDFKERSIPYHPKWTFHRLKVCYGDVPNLDTRFRDCEFAACNIRRVPNKVYSKVSFEDCNFSDTVFEGAYLFGDLRDGNNHFIEGHEPRATEHVEWLDVLKCLTEEEAGKIPF